MYFIRPFKKFTVYQKNVLLIKKEANISFGLREELQRNGFRVMRNVILSACPFFCKKSFKSRSQDEFVKLKIRNIDSS